MQNVVHNDPVTELLIIKQEIRHTDFTRSKLKGYIYATYSDPFSASLHTEGQLQLAKEHFRHGSCVLNLDATGSVIRRRPGSQKRAIVYYAVVLKGTMTYRSKTTSTLLNFNYDLNKIGCKNIPRREEIDFS